MRELIVDNFAGGGGASTGIEIATGRSVDIAINHDPEAIRMHKANHPSTKHYCESVWDVDPVKACNGHPVALAWFSPDCKHFSKAKGGKPKDKKIRGLAWVALRWAALVRPRVIILENVEEFKTWGPLNRNHRPIKSKQGQTFEKFVQQLERLGYVVETKELVAADYGAPTMRKRFFLVARCDGEPIIWPRATHAPSDSELVNAGLCQPYVGAYTQIDFDKPCPSIFDSATEIKEKYGIRAVRPLAENTMKRIARGLQKFVIDNQDPFIVPIGYGERKGQLPRVHDIKKPLPTAVGSNKHYLCAPALIQYHSETRQGEVRGQEISEPVMTVDGSNRYGLVSAFISKSYAGESRSIASNITDPLHTITARQCHSVAQVTLEKDGEPREGVKEFFEKFYGKPVFGDRKLNECDVAASHVVKMKGTNIGQHPNDPLQTITAGGQHYAVACATFISQQQGKSIGKSIEDPLNTATGINHMAEVRAFLIKYYGCGIGQDIENPLDTITVQDRFGLVTIAGIDYQIVDIGLRMLEPKELYGCQGFPDDYIIDRDFEGNTYSRTEQVKRCGNAVPPPFATALVKANIPDICTGIRMPNLRSDRLGAEADGQLKFA